MPLGCSGGVEDLAKGLGDLADGLFSVLMLEGFVQQAELV